MVNHKPQTYKKNTQKVKRKETNQNTKKTPANQTEKFQEKKGIELQSNQKTMNKISVSTYLSTITLDVNGLNALIKRHRMEKYM